MSDSGGGGGGGPGGEEGGMEVSGSAVQNVADVSVLQKHLRKLVPLLLEDGGEAPAVLEAALEEKGAVEHMRKFLSDPQVHTVLVERSTLKGEARAGRPPRSQNGGGARRHLPRATALPRGGRGAPPRSPRPPRGLSASRRAPVGDAPACRAAGPVSASAGLGVTRGRRPQGPAGAGGTGGGGGGCLRLARPPPLFFVLRLWGLS